jgi:hypothetical protein
MSANNATENSLLLLLFNNTAFANVGDAAGLRASTGAGSLFVSGHTADPGEAGVQNTSECAYTGYARSAQARSAGGWTVSGTAPTQAVNAASVTLGSMSAGGPITITFTGVGLQTSGATELLLSGASNSLVVNNSINPTIAIGGLVCTLD